jgi:predicted dehydrogenase
MIAKYKKPLNVAFIGGALRSAVGYAHFNACRLDGNFRVEAGCFSRDLDQNYQSAMAYGVNQDRVYSDWRSLLLRERGGIDVVVVLTPTPSHAEIVAASVQAGYPVICEKALAVDLDECRELEKVVRDNHGYLAVTFNYSGYPMIRELRRMIQAGRLGTLQQIHVEMPQEGFLRAKASPQSWRRRDYGVPTVSLDLGVHVHHLVDFITGGIKPSSLVGEQASYGQLPGVVDNVFCIAKYDQDLRVQAWWGKTALGHRNGLRIRVYGENASAEWYQMEPEVLRCADDSGHCFVLDRGTGGVITAQEARYNRFKPGHPSGFIEAFANLYVDIAEEVRAFIAGDPVESPYVHGVKQALDGISMMQAVSESATYGRWVEFSR